LVSHPGLLLLLLLLIIIIIIITNSGFCCMFIFLVYFYIPVLVYKLVALRCLSSRTTVIRKCKIKLILLLLKTNCISLKVLSREVCFIIKTVKQPCSGYDVFAHVPVAIILNDTLNWKQKVWNAANCKALV
jgi:hypothetical protein